MPVAGTIPTFVSPTSKNFLGIAREGVTGQPVMPTNTIPLDKSTYEPEDTPIYLPDEALRGSMAMTYGEILGPEDATFNYGGPVFSDTYGFFIDNLMGDLSTTGTIAGGSASTLNAATAVGATTATLVSASGFTAGVSVQIDTGSIAEVIVQTGVATQTIAFINNPLRFAHGSGATVQVVTGPYTHTWGLLNSGNGQPPTHTATDYTALTTSVGARSYPSLCVAQLDFTGNAEQLFAAKVTGNSWSSLAAATTPTNTTSSVVPLPNWRSVVSVAGATTPTIGEWSFSFKRQLQVYYTAQAAQNPFIIARGNLDVTGTANYTVAQDESPLTQMLNNTQPLFNVVLDNGLAGTAHVKWNFTAHNTAFVKAKPTRSAVLVGYEDEFVCVANSTDVGGSGGLGPATIQLINNIPTY